MPITGSLGGGIDSTLEDWADALKDVDPEVFTVVAHGWSQSMANKSADEWANILSAKMSDAVKVVRLYSCNVGKGENSFAEQLQHKLKSKGIDIIVEAPAAFIRWDIKQTITPVYGVGGIQKGWEYSEPQASYYFSSDAAGLNQVEENWRRFGE